MAEGKFITIEGCEGVGKSSNVNFIADYLRNKGIPVLITREPGGTPLAEEIRSILLSPREERVVENAELLLVFAARAQHLDSKIAPALKEGTWVLSDRFTDATYAYQGGGRGLDLEAIRTLETLVQGSRRPDRTILLDAPVEVGMARARNRGEFDRFESEKIAFFEAVRGMYRQRAEAEPERFLVVDAAQELASVQENIRQSLEQMLSD